MVRVLQASVQLVANTVRDRDTVVVGSHVILILSVTDHRHYPVSRDVVAVSADSHVGVDTDPTEKAAEKKSLL